MKKYFVLIAIISLLFSSCWTVPIIFDDSTPEEETARLYPYDLGTVTEYNRVTVKWKSSNFFDDKLIQIPAGDTLLQFDVNAPIHISNYTYKVRGKNILLRYYFQPQKTYTFRLVFNKDLGMYGLNVYAYNYGESLRDLHQPAKKHFVEFVQFLNGSELKEAIF